MVVPRDCFDAETFALPIPIGIVAVETTPWAPIRIGIGIGSPIWVGVAIARIVGRGRPGLELFDGQCGVGIVGLI
jgi:hypothetical protein